MASWQVGRRLQALERETPLGGVAEWGTGCATIAPGVRFLEGGDCVTGGYSPRTLVTGELECVGNPRRVRGGVTVLQADQRRTFGYVYGARTLETPLLLVVQVRFERAGGYPANCFPIPSDPSKLTASISDPQDIPDDSEHKRRGEGVQLSVIELPRCWVLKREPIDLEAETPTEVRFSRVGNDCEVVRETCGWREALRRHLGAA
jgi:hypothetical protein